MSTHPRQLRPRGQQIALEDASEVLRELYLALVTALLDEFEHASQDPAYKVRPAIVACTARFLKDQGITVKSFGQVRSGLSKLHEAAMRAPFTVVPIKLSGAKDDGDDE